MVTAIVLVTTEGERVQEAAQAMLGVEGVTEAYSVTGPYDLVVMVRIPDFERLADIVPPREARPGPGRRPHRDHGRLPRLLELQPRPGVEPRIRRVALSRQLSAFSQKN